MLKAIAHSHFSEFGVTVYQDDTLFWKFYLIPNFVSIRHDVNNKPVFLLIKYAFSDEDREANPNLAKGGGYMVFDTEMTVPVGIKNQIVAKLQEDVDQTWRQLKAIAESHGKSVQGARLTSWHNLKGRETSVSLGVEDVLLGLGPDAPEAPPGDSPPKVIISDPTWTQGTFRISAPQTEALVSHRLAEGPVSLVGNNVVSANLDLTAAGATFMEKTLTNLDGSGATDLTPLQVMYELKMWARMPPVNVRVTADSRSLYAAIQSIYHDYEGNGCGQDTLEHSDQKLEMAVQSGLIKVQVDAGTLDISDDLLQEIRSSALKTVMDMIKEKFFVKKPAPQNDDEDDPTADFIDSDSEIYYLKTDINFESMHFEYNEQIQSLREWPVNPQGTLQTFLADVSPEEMKQYVRSVNLTDSFFQTLGLNVTAFADWENEPIAFIEAQVRYTGRDENGQEEEKVRNFTFTKDKTSDIWDASLIGNEREYSFRWRVGYKGREPGEFTRWEQDTTPRLNLSIADVGKVAIQVLAGNVDFAQVTKQVQVEISYADLGSSVGEEAITLVLNAAQQEQKYQRYIYTAWDRPVRYRTRFFLKNDQTIETDWMETLNRQLLINEPNAINRLDVQLVPAANWDGVQQAVINLNYADPANGYFSEGVFAIKSLDEYKTWNVVLKDPTRRKFRYKILASFKDGSPAYQTDWLEAEGDQALPVIVLQKPRLNVKLLPTLVDFKTTPVVAATLRYDDPAGNIHKVETIPFTAATEAVWNFSIASDRSRVYRHQITYNTMDGQEINLPEVSTEETVLVLPKLQIPEIFCEVHPRIVNFVETPVVEVTISYLDEAHRLECSETLVFTDANPQNVRFSIYKDSPKDYQVAVTYYLADGRVAERAPVTLDKSKIVIPRYMPA